MTILPTWLTNAPAVHIYSLPLVKHRCCLSAWLLAEVAHTCVRSSHKMFTNTTLASTLLNTKACVC